MNHTTQLSKDIESFLLKVTTPGQYTGGEWNSIVKDASQVDCRIALAFPDAYSVGMSHHGLRILYEILNQDPAVAAERAFAPLPDMEAELRARKLPLYTLETVTPLKACDLVGFSLQYELAASNLFTMLDLAGIPLLAVERGEDDPLILAGGVGSFNPEPYAEFIDLFLIGEGEEALPELVARWRSLDRAGMSREAILLDLATHCPGWYAPALYEAGGDGGLVPRFPSLPKRILRRMVEDLNAAPQVTAPVVPVVETAHERVTLELMRGCPWGCRFCQAGMVTRPLRARSVENLVAAAKTCYDQTGYDEIGLLSLSTSDYPEFSTLIETLDAEFAPKGVNLSLPSLRVNTALRGIPEQVTSVRRGSFTIAPEAATERLRATINKAVSDEDLIAGAEAAFKAGWRTIKLYFMVGLPSETDEDVKAIPELANRVAKLRKGGGRGPAVTLSVSNYVPKPQTPFQWIAMDRPESLTAKQALIASLVNRKGVSLKAHDVTTSLLEGAVARGGREMGRVMLSAWQQGARLCAWREYFNPEAWERGFAEHGLTPEAIACTAREPGKPTPWQHVESGLQEAFFLQELERSALEERTPPCSNEHCAGCGVAGCSFMTSQG